MLQVWPTPDLLTGYRVPFDQTMNGMLITTGFGSMITSPLVCAVVTSAADLKRGYDVIRQEDPNHPVVQTHAPRGTVAELQPYNAATDLLALDIYPIGYPPGMHSTNINKEISMVGDFADFLNAVGGGQKSEERRVGKECRSRWSPYH